jgi:uncharacterized protein (DUF2141 family)
MRVPCLIAGFSLVTLTAAAGSSFATPEQHPGAAPLTQPEKCTLRIHVDGLRNSIGVVGSVIFTSPDGWPENLSKAYKSGPTPIDAGERQVTAVWEGIPPGDYGVVVLHDENSNMKLDRNFFGWPKEGFGFSNNPHIGMGPPPFRDALLHIGCPITQTTIHVIYK